MDSKIFVKFGRDSGFNFRFCNGNYSVLSKKKKTYARSDRFSTILVNVEHIRMKLRFQALKAEDEKKKASSQSYVFRSEKLKASEHRFDQTDLNVFLMPKAS